MESSQFGAVLVILAVLEEKLLLTPMEEHQKLVEAVFQAKTQQKLTVRVHIMQDMSQKMLLHMDLQINAKLQFPMALVLKNHFQSLLTLSEPKKHHLKTFINMFQKTLIFHQTTL